MFITKCKAPGFNYMHKYGVEVTAKSEAIFASGKWNHKALRISFLNPIGLAVLEAGQLFQILGSWQNPNSSLILPLVCL